MEWAGVLEGKGVGQSAAYESLGRALGDDAVALCVGVANLLLPGLLSRRKRLASKKADDESRGFGRPYPSPWACGIESLGTHSLFSLSLQ
jgi:hypothetical protein